MHDRASETVGVTRVGGSERAADPDLDEVVVESPLEVYLDGSLVATTMRTPGSDFELALGLLWSERRISGADVALRRGPGPASPLSAPENVVCVENPPEPAALDPQFEASRSMAPRLGLTASSCGVCGVEQIESLVAGLPRLGSPLDAARDLERVIAFEGPGELNQALFERTGGSHAAAALRRDGSVVVVREDIGRHNAVDKVVGALLVSGELPAHEGCIPAERAVVALWVSGRASYEIVQKCWAAGIGVLVSVGAVSALAVQTAQRAGIALVGFARGGRATQYTDAL